MATPSLYSKLLNVQDAAVTLLKADAYFADDDIITERKGDIGQKIKAALAKLGLSVRVMTPNFSLLKKQGNRKLFKVDVIIECAEIAIMNKNAEGVRRYALEAATAAAGILDNAVHGLGGAEPDTELDRFDLEADSITQPDPDLLVYQVHLSTHISITN